jgi:hypothetical protein
MNVQVDSIYAELELRSALISKERTLAAVTLAILELALIDIVEVIFVYLSTCSTVMSPANLLYY